MRYARSILILLASLALVAAPALAGYTSGGTFVVRSQFGTIVDNGGVVCEGANGDGIGGGCLLFPRDLPPFPEQRFGGFVSVFDQVAGKNVAFQVCIDNNGDGICGGPNGNIGPCFDQIFFSHNDAGEFFNALGPLPTSFLPGCGGGFPGYVVLLCQGAHELPDGSTHTHQLTQGTIHLATAGSGYGDFCGGGASGGGTGLPSGNVSTVAKAYKVV